MVQSKQAFTLIELLIVVLIIGILATVAVAQYRLAVDKTRISSVLSLMKSIGIAQNVYRLANGNYASAWEDLDITKPQDVNCRISSTTTGSIYCYVPVSDGSTVSLEHYYGGGYLDCWYYDNMYVKKLCGSLAGSRCGFNGYNACLISWSN